MNPSRLFILRPVATSLLMVAILLVGIVAYRQLPGFRAARSRLSESIQVANVLSRAPNPEVMASSVTAPLERQFGQVPGLQPDDLEQLFWPSSVVTLQFALDQNIDIGEQEVQAAINASQTYLPADLPNPPIYSKVNPADAPILTVALTSKNPAASLDRRSRRYDDGAENFAGDGGGTSFNQWRPKARSKNPGEPHRAGFLWT